VFEKDLNIWKTSHAKVDGLLPCLYSLS